MGRKLARAARNCSGPSGRKIADEALADEWTIGGAVVGELVVGELAIAEETSDEPGIGGHLRSYDNAMQAVSAVIAVTGS